MLRALADRLEVARPAYLSPDETEHQHYCNKTLQRLQIESLNKENSLVYIKLKKDHVRKREDRMPSILEDPPKSFGLSLGSAHQRKLRHQVPLMRRDWDQVFAMLWRKNNIKIGSASKEESFRLCKRGVGLIVYLVG